MPSPASLYLAIPPVPLSTLPAGAVASGPGMLRGHITNRQAAFMELDSLHSVMARECLGVSQSSPCQLCWYHSKGWVFELRSQQHCTPTASSACPGGRAALASRYIDPLPFTLLPTPQACLRSCQASSSPGKCHGTPQGGVWTRLALAPLGSRWLLLAGLEQSQELP